MNNHKHMKRTFILLLFWALTLVCNAQNLLDGKWYLQEVQIPSNEEFTDGIRYGKYECLFFSGENNKEVLEEWVDPDAFMEAFDESYEDAVASLEDGCNKIIFEKFNDSVLVINPSYGVYDVYVIKKLTKDVLILATDRTFQGYTMYVYGRTKQPIKHSKHNIVSNNNDSYPNPIVNRLSNKEIVSSRTPSAVAYNFVNAILNSERARMLSYMDTESANAFEKNAKQMDMPTMTPSFPKTEVN